jgi:murein L,D-transpeptidase YafK
MKTKMYLVVLSLTGLSFAHNSDFLSDQKRNARVGNAYTEKEFILSSRLKGLNLTLENINILIVAYKNEKELDLYVKGKTETGYKKLATYPVCRISGQPGPKRHQNDLQIPEGFYVIDKFNPNSNYYLSLGISYPNSSDRIKCKSKDPGGDIYIHGECVTIGCLPMTNDKIKEIYIYAIQARENGQHNIPVYIFPFRFTEINVAKMKETYKTDVDLLDFWDNLKAGYDKFNRNFNELNVGVDKKNGKYIIR